MTLTADILRAQIEYTAWASARLVKAAAAISSEELIRDFGTADRSVLGTLVHIFAADRVWLPRLQGGPSPTFVTDADRSLVVLQTEWPALHDRWREWACNLTDEQAGEVIPYRDLKGNPWSHPAWQIVFHVVNHATHHRGQVSGFLRSMDHTPPSIDQVHYWRER